MRRSLCAPSDDSRIIAVLVRVPKRTDSLHIAFFVDGLAVFVCNGVGCKPHWFAADAAGYTLIALVAQCLSSNRKDVQNTFGTNGSKTALEISCRICFRTTRSGAAGRFGLAIRLLIVPRTGRDFPTAFSV
jgi:hypothetical protein